MSNFNDELITVKEVCELLNCGRTKIYTYYLAKDILKIRRKIGNRTLFLKSDILKIRDEEATLLDTNLDQEFHQTTLTPKNFTVPNSTESKNEEQENIDQNLYSNKNYEQTDETEKNTNASQILLPARPLSETESREKLVSDYINDLKQQVHEQEQTIRHQQELIDAYKTQIKNSVNIIDFNEQMKAKEQLLLETKTKMEERERTLCEQNERYATKLKQSLKATIYMKEKLDEEQAKLDEERAKRELLTKLQTRWKLVQKQLSECGFFDFSTKKRLKTELEQILISIQNFQ